MSLLKENCVDGVLVTKSKNKKDAAKRADVLVEHLRVAEHALKVLDPADVPGACAGSAPGGAEDSDAAKAPIGWSKSMAYQNMRFIDVTLDVFQAPMSSLKAVEKWNNCSMSVTSAVSHAEMGPYAASAPARSDSHSSTAALIVSSFIARPPPTSPSTAAQSRMVEHLLGCVAPTACGRTRRGRGQLFATGALAGAAAALYVVHRAPGPNLVWYYLGTGTKWYGPRRYLIIFRLIQLIHTSVAKIS